MMNSQPTLTAIVRLPSTAPLILTPEYGIDGHKSAVHDAQVYAFFSKHYDYWTARLSIERSQWDWAFWGENLTLDVPDGVDERNIMLGDRWVFSNPSHKGSRHADSTGHEGLAVGDDSVVLEVCGGRSPCSRLAWRCGQPASWLAEAAKTGFCGVYLKVVRGGSISPGDKVTVVPTKSTQTAPVATIAQCLFAPLEDPNTRAMARRILRVEGLQNMNKKTVARRLAMIEDAEAAGRNRWRGWRTLKVTRVVDECALVKSFHLAAADDKPLADYVPGQYLTIKLPSGQIRCWSISSWSPVTTTSVPPSYRITVKRGPSASLYLHSEVRAGDTILARSPSGIFVPNWAKGTPNRQVYISAGIGMTPILSMLQAHFSHPTLSKTQAILVHVSRNSEEEVPLLKSEVAASSFLRTIKFYTAPIPGVDVKGRDYDLEGRPTFKHLAPILGESYYIDPLGVTPIELPGHASNAYMCGPQSFVEDMRTYLEQCNIPTDAIQQETFTYGSSPSSVGDVISSTDGLDLPEKATVRFRGREVSWDKGEGLSLLELMEQEGKGENPESACRVGDCGTCEVRILKGEARVSNNAGKEAKEATGKPGTMIRSCCSFPTSEILDLEF
ncbi:Flavohemoprotein [Diaporthe eres]|nr:Flavohemoprotein [Diaporthe eres]